MDSSSSTPIYDCIVLGGSYAGLTAALTLGRATRRVLVIDAGNPRNASSKGINNLPGSDGIAPGAWRNNVLKEIGKYPTVEIAEQSNVVSARRVSETPTRFEVAFHPNGNSNAGKTVNSRTIILAMGVINAMPSILDGLSADKSLWWGSRVFHCPYCSAFEIADRPLGILALPHTTPQDAAGMAGQLSVWAPGKVTLLTNGRAWDKEGWFNAAQLASMGTNRVSLVTDPIASIAQDPATLDLIVSFTTGRQPLVLYSLHLRPTFSLASPSIVSSLGPTMRGPLIQTDPMGKTDSKGVWAAGDCMEGKAQVLLAMSTGTVAAFGVAGDLGLSDWNDGKLGGRL